MAAGIARMVQVVLITTMSVGVGALHPLLHAPSRHLLARRWAREVNRGDECTHHPWSRSDFLRANIRVGVTAAALLSSEVSLAYVDFDKDWADVEIPSKAKKPLKGKVPSSFRQPSSSDSIAKQLSKGTDSAARTAQRQGKALTREVKAAAYDAETIGRKTEREFKKAADDPGTYVKKKADSVNRAAQKKVKIATRDAKKLTKEVNKDPVLYAQKKAEKASIAAQRGVSSIARDAQERAKGFEKEVQRVF